MPVPVIEQLPVRDAVQRILNPTEIYDNRRILMERERLAREEQARLELIEQTRLNLEERAYFLRRYYQQPWSQIAEACGYSGESVARASAARFARRTNQPPLTTPNPRRSAAARVAVAARFGIPVPPTPIATRTFGCEIEYVVLRNYALTRPKVAEAIAVALGVPHIHTFRYHDNVCETCGTRVTEQYLQWKVESDGSVDGEVVSPVLAGAEGFKQIKVVMKAMRDAGCKIDDRCGAHIHIGVKDLDKNQRVNLIKKWYANQPMVRQFVARQRWTNHYCVNPQDRELQEWYRRILVGNDPTKNEHGITRTATLNITPFPKIGTYEIRFHQGTLNAKKLGSWIKFLLAFVEYATVDGDIENPTQEEFGILKTLIQPIQNKNNLFTQREADYLLERVAELAQRRRR
jgi:AraC-like DNA-binding protein